MTAHPLDVELADLVDGALEDARVAPVEAHLARCLLCRIKFDRIRDANPDPAVDRPPLPSPTFRRPDREAGAPSPGDVRLAGEGEHLLLAVLAIEGDRAVVAPVTFDVEAADHETVLLEDEGLAAHLAVHVAVTADVPTAALGDRVGTVPVSALGAAGRRGAPITDAGDLRLDVRQELADRLAALTDLGPEPDPPAGPEQLRSSLISDLRALRGATCTVRPLFGWGDVLPADRAAGWEPLAAVDELGIVLIVVDTPHGLEDDDDFSRARTVLTRLNGTALVVLASAISDLADVFDAPALHHGIDAPSGAHSAPRPLISELAPFDAIAKFLDRTTGVHATTPAARGPVRRVDVADILRTAARDALADTVRQGARFKIVPKRNGYGSLAGVEDAFAGAMARALEADSDPLVVEALLDLARRDDE